MKKTLRIMIVFVSIAALYCVLFVFSRTGNIEDFSIVFNSNIGTQKLKWHFNETDEKWYIFLPKEADENNLKLSFLSSKKVTVNGEEIKTEKETAVFKDLGEFELICGNDSYPLVIMKDDSLTSVFINTASGSLKDIYNDKNYKEAADIAVFEDGKLIFDELEYIKGRGNSTWWVPEQKPYNISFKEEIDFLGLGEAKNYCLLTNHNNYAQLMNTTVYKLARELDLAYTPDNKLINLYINGEYQGIYLLTEKIEVAENRVAINNLEEDNKAANPDIKFKKLKLIHEDDIRYYDFNDPDDYSGGYLLESNSIERYKTNSDPGFVAINDLPINIKEPAYISHNELLYIKDYYNRLLEGLMSEDGYNSNGEYYSELVDMDSLARMYLLQEFVCNVDGGYMSFFLYKDRGEKICIGPAWDFDSTFGLFSATKNGIDFSNNDKWYARYGAHPVNRDEKPYVLKTIFYYANKHEDFREYVKELWKELLEEFEKYPSYVLEEGENLRTSMAMDNIVQMGMISDFGEDVDLYNRANRRIEYLNKGFSDECVVSIEYISEYNSSPTIQHDILINGETAVVRNCYYAPDDKCAYRFLYWIDKEGNIYYPGDEVTVGKEILILEAVYEK